MNRIDTEYPVAAGVLDGIESPACRSISFTIAGTSDVMREVGPDGFIPQGVGGSVLRVNSETALTIEVRREDGRNVTTWNERQTVVPSSARVRFDALQLARVSADEVCHETP